MNSELLLLLSSVFPVNALYFCYIYSHVSDLNSVTSTECSDETYFPKNVVSSISRAIGFNSVTSNFWLICVLLSMPFRLMLARRLYFVYIRLFQITNEEKARAARWRIKLAIFFNIMEIAGLLVLSIFTSRANYDMHKLGFLTHLASSFGFMALVCSIESRLKAEKLPNSYDTKIKIAFSYLATCVLTAIVYTIHMAACMDYVYSIFGLCEVLLSLLYIYFNASYIFFLRTTTADMACTALNDYETKVRTDQMSVNEEKQTQLGKKVLDVIQNFEKKWLFLWKQQQPDENQALSLSLSTIATNRIKNTYQQQQHQSSLSSSTAAAKATSK